MSDKLSLVLNALLSLGDWKTNLTSIFLQYLLQMALSLAFKVIDPSQRKVT